MDDREHVETSASIAAWAENVFGPCSDLSALVRRAELELAELRTALDTGTEASEVHAEAADVAILLHRLVALKGADLCEAVDAKMIVNRARQWTPTGDGTGRHKQHPTPRDEKAVL